MRRLREHLPALGVFVLGVAAWESAVYLFGIEFYLLPAPHVIATSLRQSYPVLLEASLFQTRQAWSAILVACLLGLAFYGVVALVERLAVPWRAERERARP